MCYLCRMRRVVMATQMAAERIEQTTVSSAEWVLS
jgi:hypothetical protein